MSGNVEWLDGNGDIGGRLCAHPDMAAGWLPTADVIASQVLALITDEPGSWSWPMCMLVGDRFAGLSPVRFAAQSHRSYALCAPIIGLD